MGNIFDLIDDFYSGDEEWNSVLKKSDVENYFRTKSWRGCSEDELVEIWNNILIFCIYLGNSEKYLTNMSREDFIDCVAWCIRNVSEFESDPEFIAKFLDDVADFYVNLRRKKLFMSMDGPRTAKEKLIVNGKLQLLNEKGEFNHEVEKTNIYSTPDLPSKIILNLGNSLNKFMRLLGDTFSKKEFHHEIERANFYFCFAHSGGNEKFLPGMDDPTLFWDYFFFDYRLWENDHSILHEFKEMVLRHDIILDNKVNLDIIDILQEAQMTFFTVQGMVDEGVYDCYDIFNHENYMLQLPLEEGEKTEGIVYMSHVFYNKSLVTNGFYDLKKSKVAYNRFIKEMELFKKWMELRTGDLSWNALMKEFPEAVRLIYLFGLSKDAKNQLEKEVKTLQHLEAEVLSDAITRHIGQMMRSNVFSASSIQLARQMWWDYVEKSGKKLDSIRKPEVWAAGVIKLFCDINKVYSMTNKDVTQMSNGLTPSSFKRTADEIDAVLNVGVNGGRYLNEDSLLLFLSY